MYNKVSPIMIVILLVTIVAVAAIGFKFLGNPDGKELVNEVVGEKVSEILPVLELTKNTNEKNQETVLITAVATTEDEAGIAAIILPDGSEKEFDSVTYEVNKNGSYTFKVKGKNGKISSEVIEITNIAEISADNPYMPEGFSYSSGEVETGYVIKDVFGNEFVWVPVPDGKMVRNKMMDPKYAETASGVVNSVAQNYGFYIGKYEASKYEINGKTVAASIGEVNPWVDVTYGDAADAASKTASAFGYEDCQTSIINSYAWDTTLAWLDKSTENYSTNTGYGNYSGELRNTGATELDIRNNICDLAGNVREWTMEIYKPTQKKNNTTTKPNNKNVVNEVMEESVTYRVVRGGSANLSRTASSNTGYKENDSNAYWGFRVILYK